MQKYGCEHLETSIDRETLSIHPVCQGSTPLWDLDKTPINEAKIASGLWFDVSYRLALRCQLATLRRACFFPPKVLKRTQQKDMSTSEPPAKDQ